MSGQQELERNRHIAKVMSPRNIVEFASEAEAINNGYRKAKNCR